MKKHFLLFGMLGFWASVHGQILAPEFLSACSGELLASNGQQLFFICDHTATGREPWVTDGTEAGTSLLKNIAPGADSGFGWPGSSNSFFLSNVVAPSQQFFFAANDGANGLEPWISDGTEAGTKMLKDLSSGSVSGVPNSSFASHFHPHDGKVFFSLGQYGFDGWASTDGTSNGTEIVETGKKITQFASLGDDLLFVGGFKTATDDEHGALWKSDGTASGTTLLMDFGKIEIGVSGSIHWVEYINSPAGVAAYGQKALIFVKMPRLVLPTDPSWSIGQERWRLVVSDGTAAGTTALSGEFLAQTVQKIVQIGPNIFFIGHELISNTNGLWRLDSDDFELVAAIPPSASPIFKITDDQAVFFAKAGDGVQMWRTDGTSGGTFLQTTVRADEPAAIFRNGLAENGTVYFSVEKNPATQANYTSEFWKTDGTSAGTIPISTAFFLPSSFKKLGDHLVFTAVPEGGQAGLHRLCVENCGPTSLDEASEQQAETILFPNPSSGQTRLFLPHFLNEK